MGGMSEDKGPARPRQVTTAVVVAVVGCLVLVIGLFDTLGRLRTPAMREAIDEFLGQAPGDTLALTTEQVVSMLRTLAFFSGALAAAALVCAVFALQRHRGARVGYTVAAGLLLLTVPVAGLMPFFLVAAAILLWSGAARQWYAGRPLVAAGPLPSRGATAAAVWSVQDPGPAAGQPPGAAPGPPPGPAPQPAVHQPGYHPPGHQPPAYQLPYGVAAPPVAADAAKRPLTVTLAAVLTWIGAGATALLMLGFVLLLALGGDAFVDEFERAARESQVTLTRGEALALGWAVALTLLTWSLIAAVLAIFAFRRSNGARWALAVSAAMTAVVSLLAILSLLSAVTLLLGGAAAILLFTGGANQWFSRRPAPSAYAGYPGYPPQPPPAAPPAQQPPGRTKPW
jgi:hypothetical protein